MGSLNYWLVKMTLEFKKLISAFVAIFLRHSPPVRDTHNGIVLFHVPRTWRIKTFFYQQNICCGKAGNNLVSALVCYKTLIYPNHHFILIHHRFIYPQIIVCRCQW